MSDGKTVHIVDDEPAVRDSLELLLKSEGFDVQIHASARACLEAIGEETGCVVTDVRMPEVSGLDLLANIVERPLAPPVIVITAYADVALAVQAMQAGAIDLLVKPFDDIALVNSIRRALTRSMDEQARYKEMRANTRETCNLDCKGTRGVGRAAEGKVEQGHSV